MKLVLNFYTGMLGFEEVSFAGLKYGCSDSVDFVNIHVIKILQVCINLKGSAGYWYPIALKGVR